MRREGAARLHRTDGVFFNPKQLLQRDLSVLIAQEYASLHPEKEVKGLHVVDAFSGCGVRALRYALEVHGVRQVTANDLDAAAVHALQENADHSGVGKDVLTTAQEPANTLLDGLCKTENRVDILDLDPCGSVAEVLPHAVSCLADGGLLLASCTDLASMNGRFGDQGARRYGAEALRDAHKQAPELALRMLLACLSRAAASANRRIEPLVSVVFADFFVRVVVRVHAVFEDANQPTGDVGDVHHCAACGTLAARPTVSECEHCGRRAMTTGGPFFLGPSCSKAFLAALLERIDASYRNRQPSTGTSCPEEATFGSFAVLRPLLQSLCEEASLPRAIIPFSIPACCRLLRARSVPLERLLHGWSEIGRNAVRAHWDPCTIKVRDQDACLMWDTLVGWAKEHPAECDGVHSGASSGKEEVRKRLMERRAVPEVLVTVPESSLHMQKRRRVDTARPRLTSGGNSSDCGKLSLPDAGAQERKWAGGGEQGQQHSATVGCKFQPATCQFPYPRDAFADEATPGMVTVLFPPFQPSAPPFTAEESRPPATQEVGRFSSLRAAVAAAPPNARLLIGRGEYVETRSVHIDRPLTISAAKGSKLVKCGVGSALVVEMRASRAGTARDAAEAQRGQVNVSGLAIVQSRVPHAEAGGAAADNGGNGGDNDAALVSTSQLEEETAGYAIVTRGGRAVFVQCSVESEVSGCCFASASSTVELKGCHLKRAAAHGVLVSGKADVQLSHCHIQSTGAACVEVRGRSKTRVHACRVHHSQRSGLFASGFGELRVDYCNLFNCAYAAIETAAESEAYVEQCRIHHGARGGVLALGRSQLLLQKCELSANAMAGVSVRGSACARLADNRIADGRSSGVHVSESATAELTGNRVLGHRLCGLELEGYGATLRALRNDLSGNGGEALCLPPPEAPRDAGARPRRAPSPVLEDNILASGSIR